jgi:hypothetical protein
MTKSLVVHGAQATPVRAASSEVQYGGIGRPSTARPMNIWPNLGRAARGTQRIAFSRGAQDPTSIMTIQCSN